MKGIYLTPESKQEIEAKIAELEQYAHEESDIDGIQFSDADSFDIGERNGKILKLKEILSSATILPVEESWETAVDRETILYVNYPNGLIIQPKQ
jgi:predicted glycosyltransferase involved in capsule biosynthesis